MLAAADTGVNPFSFVLARQAIDFWLGASDAAARADANVAFIAAATQREAARADAARSAWAERPLRAGLVRAATGDYVNDRLGRATVTPDGDVGLFVEIGVYRAEVRPVGEGFAIVQTDTMESDRFHFVSGASGEIEAIIIDDDRYDRARASRP